jgi:hypothetical protein
MNKMYELRYEVVIAVPMFFVMCFRLKHQNLHFDRTLSEVFFPSSYINLAVGATAGLHAILSWNSSDLDDVISGESPR